MLEGERKIESIMFNGQTYLAPRNPIRNPTPPHSKVKLGHVRQIAKNIFCLPDWNHASVAVRVCIDRVGLGRVERVQHVLADYAFDAVGADEDGCVGGSCIGEGQSDI